MAIAQVGVKDMLRFNKFTIGFNRISDYGNSEKDEANFRNLYAFSPLQNIKAGLNYPGVLVTTADHDDRVVPAHSFKYMATMQEKYTGTEPVLVRIDTHSWHGASNTKKKYRDTGRYLLLHLLQYGCNAQRLLVRRQIN